MPGPVSADSDFQQRTLRDLSRALAILQDANVSLMGPAGVSPPSECSSQSRLFAELPISNRESSLSGPLFKPLEFLAEGSPGAAPDDGVMPEPVAPGDVTDAIDPRGIFASADATIEEGNNEAPMTEDATSMNATAEEGRTPMAEERSHEAPTAEEGSNEAPTVEEGGNEAPTAVAGSHKAPMAVIATSTDATAEEGSHKAPTAEAAAEAKAAAKATAAEGDKAAAEATAAAEAKAAAETKATAEVKSA